MFTPTKYQAAAIQTVDANVIVNACPGSGKTSILAIKMENLIEKYKVQPSDCMALTHTNVAVSNLRRRLDDITIHSEAVTISTIHSFAMKLVQDDVPERWLIIVMQLM